MTRPAISVILPVHNGEAYLRDAIDSIIWQSFPDWELLVVDDGSTDRSNTIAQFCAVSDPRIRILRLAAPRGLPAALNAGLKVARGDFIARMDGDDISLPFRFEHQVRYLRAHPEVQLVGSAIRYMDQHGRDVRTVTFPRTQDQIRFGLLFDNKIAHPTVMLRADALREASLLYSDSYGGAEDYDLWVRFTRRFTARNLDTVHLRYRIHSGQVRSYRLHNQLTAADRISAELVQDLSPGIEWSRDVRVFLDVLYWRSMELLAVAGPPEVSLSLAGIAATVNWRRRPDCAASLLAQRVLQTLAAAYLSRHGCADPVLIAISRLL